MPFTNQFPGLGEREEEEEGEGGCCKTSKFSLEGGEGSLVKNNCRCKVSLSLSPHASPLVLCPLVDNLF